jgi:hypothetical protein
MAWRYGGAAISINNGIWLKCQRSSAGAGIWQRKEKQWLQSKESGVI